MGTWYLPRKEIEENSPSRKDGIDFKKETSLRKSYCTFLKDLGMTLQLPLGTIATAIIFCHRFFLRQSHAKNDQRTIATVCMFLAAKVKETPRPLQHVILVSYKMIHKKDPAAVKRIQQKDMYEQQKELILLGERVLLTTLDFDMDVPLPYEPLAEAIIKFNVAKNSALVRVAWCFVDDGLSTSLCLQFKPTHIAAGALFLAAKFLRVNLLLDDKVWWQEFNVTPCQLEEVSYQMMELYEQKRIPTSQGSEAEGAPGWGTRDATKVSATIEDQTSKNNAVPLKTEMGRDTTNHRMDLVMRESQSSEKLPQKDNKSRQVVNRSKSWTYHIVARDQDIIRAALEKRRKDRSEMTTKKGVIDEDDLIERREIKGVELAVENEKKNKRERRPNWSDYVDHEETRYERQRCMKGQLQRCMNEYIAEEGEVIDDSSFLLSNCKRKMGSPPARQPEMKKRQFGSNYRNWH